MDKREKFIDIARGISILLMIIGHNIEKGILRDFIYSFHMPLFIIVSGMFYKDKTFKKILKDTIIKLFLPYMLCLFIVDYIYFSKQISFFNIITKWLEQTIYSISYIDKIKYSDVLLTGVLWFIPFLITIKLIFCIIKKLFKNNKLHEYIACCFLTIIGIGLGAFGYYLPFSLDVAFACMFFYWIGYMLYSTKGIEKIFKDNFLLFIMVCIWVLGIATETIEIATRSYQSIFSYLAAVCGSLIILKFSKFFESKKIYTNNFLAWCGKNSLYILLIHYIENTLLRFEVLKIRFDNIYIEIFFRILIDIIGAYVVVQLYKLVRKIHLMIIRKKYKVKEKEIEKVSCN